MVIIEVETFLRRQQSYRTYILASPLVTASFRYSLQANAKADITSNGMFIHTKFHEKRSTGSQFEMGRMYMHARAHTVRETSSCSRVSPHSFPF
jgi:hypothetical protein